MRGEMENREEKAKKKKKISECLDIFLFLFAFFFLGGFHSIAFKALFYRL